MKNSNTTEDTFTSTTQEIYVDKFDIDYRIKCETNLTAAVKKLEEANKEVKDLEAVISKLEGGIYLFEQYLKEKYSISENANVDAETGLVTYK